MNEEDIQTVRDTYTYLYTNSMCTIYIITPIQVHKKVSKDQDLTILKNRGYLYISLVPRPLAEEKGPGTHRLYVSKYP